MTRTIAAAFFALFTFTAPAHAALVDFFTQISSGGGATNDVIDGTLAPFATATFEITSPTLISTDFNDLQAASINTLVPKQVTNYPFTYGYSQIFWDYPESAFYSLSGAYYYANGTNTNNPAQVTPTDLVTVLPINSTHEDVVLTNNNPLAATFSMTAYVPVFGQLVSTASLSPDPPSPTPLPPALLLFATGIGLLAAVAAVRKRRNARA
jgi:hypothetical protein